MSGRSRPKKGDLLRYTGEYDPLCAARYGVGQVVAFRNYRTVVTVRLVEESQELYADWPVEDVAFVV